MIPAIMTVLDGMRPHLYEIADEYWLPGTTGLLPSLHEVLEDCRKQAEEARWKAEEERRRVEEERQRVKEEEERQRVEEERRWVEEERWQAEEERQRATDEAQRQADEVRLREEKRQQEVNRGVDDTDHERGAQPHPEEGAQVRSGDVDQETWVSGQPSDAEGAHKASRVRTRSKRESRPLSPKPPTPSTSGQAHSQKRRLCMSDDASPPILAPSQRSPGTKPGEHKASLQYHLVCSRTDRRRRPLPTIAGTPQR
jgi:hypothetical protein